MKTLWPIVVHWVCTPVCIYRTGTSVCVHVSLQLSSVCVCVSTCALLFRLWGIERAHTQVKPEGCQEDMCTGLWPPTVVKSFTLSIPSSCLPQHHPFFPEWARTEMVLLHQPWLSDSKTFPYLMCLAQHVHLWAQLLYIVHSMHTHKMLKFKTCFKMFHL